MDWIFKKLSVVFLAIALYIYGRIKKKEKDELDKRCVKVKAKIVNYEEDEERFGRYIYEYEYNGKKYRAGLDKLVQRGKKDKVETKFGKEDILYCDKKNPKHIEKVNEYLPMLSTLGSVIILIFAILFV